MPLRDGHSIVNPVYPSAVGGEQPRSRVKDEFLGCEVAQTHEEGSLDLSNVYEGVQAFSHVLQYICSYYLWNSGKFMKMVSTISKPCNILYHGLYN